MTVKLSKLSESITLRTITTEKFKTGMLAVSVSMKKTAMTLPYNLLLSGIMRRGTEKYPSIAALNRQLDELYAATVEIKSSKYGENEVFSLMSELLDNDYAEDGTDIADGVLDILSQILFSPKLSDDMLFPEKNVAQEKKIAADNLRSIINNPRGYSMLRLSEIMEKDNPTKLTLAQTIDAVENADRESITRYYREEIAPRPLEFFYVGSLTEEEISKKILSHFGSHKATLRETPAPIFAKSPSQNLTDITESMPLSQGKLALGFRTGVCANNKEHYALTVLNEIYGTSPISKLFMNVREKMSLCYFCSSSYNMYTGTMIVSSGIESSDREKAQAAILLELENIKRGKITTSELNAAKKSLENWYRQIFDNPFDLYNFYLGRSLFSINCTVDECRDELLCVTLEDVIEVAQKISLDTAYFLCGTGEGGEEYEE